MLLLLALILPLTSFAFPFNSQPQTGTASNTEAFTPSPKLPNLLEPTVYHDFWFYVGQWLDNYAHWVANQFRVRVGSYTEGVLIPSVYAASSVGHADENTITYVDPAVTILKDGSYEYMTSFGKYVLMPTKIMSAYTISYTTPSGNTVVQSSIMLLTDGRSYTEFPSVQFSQNKSKHLVLNDHFSATTDISDKGTIVGEAVLTVQFSKSAYPKITVALNFPTHPVDVSCTNHTKCKYASYWDDHALGQYQWVWLIGPDVQHAKLESKTKGDIAFSQVTSNLNDAPSQSASFQDDREQSGWFADWHEVGQTNIQLSPQTVLGQSAVIVLFPLNLSYIDPTFGLASTGSTSYPTAKSITAVGNAQIDTAQSKFGGASILFDGTGDCLTLADSAAWFLGTNAFTIDFWVRWATISADYEALAVQHTDSDNSYYFRMAPYAARKFEIVQQVAGVETTILQLDSNPNLVVDTWYHIAFVRSGNTWYVFQNGVSLGSASSTASLANLTGVLSIGGNNYWDIWYLNGWIDEFRWSNGIARWTAAFSGSLPAARYDRDSYANLLAHMDGTDTSTTILDDVVTGQAIATQATLADSNAAVSSMSFYSHAAGNFRAAIYSSTTPAIANGVSCNGNSTGATATCTLTSNPANSLVIVTTGAITTAAVQSVDFSGVSGTYLTGVSQSTVSRGEVWWAYLYSSGNIVVTVTWATSTRRAITAQSFTGTAISSPFEGTATNSGSGASVQTTTVTVAAGTTGRRIFNAVTCSRTANAAASCTIAPTVGAEITENDLAGTSGARSMSAESNYYDSSNQTAMEATATQASATLSWTSIGTAILPSTNTTAPNAVQLDCPDTAASATAWTTVLVGSCTPNSLTLAAGAYWLVLQWNPGAAYLAGPSYTAGSAGNGNRIDMAYAAFPASWNKAGATNSETYSLYVTYSTTQNLSATLSSSGSGSESVTRALVESRSGSSSGSGSESATVQKVLARSFSDAGSGLVSILATISGYRTNSDVGSGQESLARLLTSNQAPSSSGSGSETISTLKTITRTFTDLGSGMESLAQIFGHNIGLTDQGIGTETLSRLFASGRSVSDTGTGSESTLIFKALQRTFTDLGSGLESVLRVLGIVRTPTTESGSGSESVNILQTLSRANSISGSGAETLTAQQLLGRMVLDAGTGLENLISQIMGQASVTDTGAGQETLNRLFTGGRTAQELGSGTENISAQQMLQRTLADLGSGLDAVMRLFVASRSSTESGTGLETVSAGTVLQRIMSDTGSGLESLVRQVIFGRTGTDTGSGTETVTSQTGLSRVISDLGSGLESLAQIFGKGVSLTDQGTGIETLSRLFSGGRSATDVGSGLESLIRQLIFGRSTTETGTGTESVSAQQVLQRLTSETGTGLESVLRQITFGRGPSDVGSGSESTSITQTINRLLSDLGSGIENILRQITFTRTNSESGSGSETMSTQATLQKLLAESGTGIEVINIQIVFGRTVTDLGSGLESLTAILTTIGSYIANISDLGSGIETLSRLFAGTRSASDTGVGIEVSSVQLIFTRTLADMGSGLEFLARIITHTMSITDYGSGAETLSRLFAVRRGIFDLGSALEALTHLLTPYVPPSTGGAGGGVILKPLPTTVMVGAVFPRSIYFLLPGARVSQDITVTNPTNMARTVTVHYTVTNVATGKIVYQDTLHPTVSPGSSTYTTQVTVTETGRYRIDITATDGGTATAKQEFDISLWQVWQGPVLLWSIIAFVAAALILFYRKIQEEW